MYSVLKIYVKNPVSEIYKYCAKITTANNSLRNAALFRIRQVLTMFSKSPDEVTSNEREVYEEIKNALPYMPHDHSMPSKGNTYLGSQFLQDLFRATKNPDFFCDDLPMQSAQATLKEVEEEMGSFYALCRQYWANPNGSVGKPGLPRYGKPGGVHTVSITNQDAVIYDSKVPGKHVLKLPKTKVRLDLGKAPITGRLKQVKIIPTHGVFLITLIFENKTATPQLNDKPERICSIDLGVNNFAAITNNIGKPCLLFKGGVVKQANQWYNKRMAKIKSEQTKGTTNRFHPTEESQKLCIWRENFMSDYMHKTAKAIINWCLENNIDAIVIGQNKGWKQNSNMGKDSNQTFVSIPYDKFKNMLTYLGERYGIRVEKQEESYTSKASFLDNDPIPTYGENGADEVKFSGKRAPTRYSTGFEPMYRKNGFRGLYTAGDGTIINSDLNGSANIGRKRYPDMYERGQYPDFNNVIVIVHPDYAKAVAERQKQLAKYRGPSKSKLRRQRRKAQKKNVTQKQGRACE